MKKILCLLTLLSFYGCGVKTPPVPAYSDKKEIDPVIKYFESDEDSTNKQDQEKTK